MLAAFVVLALTMAVSFRTTHHEDGPPVTRSGWLRLHPPRQARHDNELLRRRMLMSIAELPPQDLTQHVPQLIACLGHNDRHVRELALGLLRKMPASALADRTTSLVQLLAQGNSDDAIRLYVLHSRVELGDMPTIAAASSLVFECLSVSDPPRAPEVQKAAIAAMALLEPEDLAPFTQATGELLVRRRDVALANVAISSWGMLLESEACSSRAGKASCRGVLETLRKLVGS